MKVRSEEVFEIDLLRMIRVLWQRAWILILAILAAGAAAFSCARFLVTPKYTSTALMYVNYGSISLGSASLSIDASQVGNAERLVDTYIVILQTRSTLEEVIKKADLPYDYTQLRSMLSAGSVNGTVIFCVTATASDPEEAALIANTVADVLPGKINSLIDGSSARVVDRAVADPNRISPNYTKYTAVGMLIGALLSALIIVILDMADDVIRDEDYLLQTYDVPILAQIPDLADHAGKKSYFHYDPKSCYSAYNKM